MLSDTDIHYIAAFLYVASGGDVAKVTLGEKLLDAAALELRDVDIAVVSTSRSGVVAAEVKNHRRPLDVIVVEGLCRKFVDMPDVTQRAIVSSSGFTAPARRKAAYHEVECLTLVRGPIPRLKTIDLSLLQSAKVDDTEWSDGPHVIFGPSLRITDRQRQLLGGNTRFDFGAYRLTADQVLQQMAEQIDFDRLPFEPPGVAAVDCLFPFQDPPTIRLGSRRVQIPDARLTGTVTRTLHRIPLKEGCYLADDQGEPKSAVLLFELRGRLIGITTSAVGPALRVFHVPSAARERRPVRRRLL